MEFSFKIWLEDEQEKYDMYKDLVLGKLNSGKKKTDYDVSTAISVWKPTENLVSELESLGEFKNLSDDKQKQIKDKISSGDGTLEDVIRLMAK